MQLNKFYFYSLNIITDFHKDICSTEQHMLMSWLMQSTMLEINDNKKSENEELANKCAQHSRVFSVINNKKTLNLPYKIKSFIKSYK